MTDTRQGLRITSLSDAQLWLSSPREGSHVVYHVGNLAHDRGRGNARVDELGNFFWRAHLQGRVALVQERISTDAPGQPGVCAYIAIRRPMKFL